MYKVPFLFCLLSFFHLTAKGQPTDFRAGLKANDPSDKTLKLEPAEQLERHQKYLSEAVVSGDSLQLIYANLYLHYDFLRKNNYPEASRYLITAEGIAEDSKNVGWIGWLSLRRGGFHVRLKDDEKTCIAAYERAVEYCRLAGDSLCVGEALEQMAAMYTMLENFAQAKYYFDAALPLLKRYGNELQYGTAMGNYGIRLLINDQYREAIPYFNEAIALHEKTENWRSKGKAMNNLANAYRLLKDYDRAIQMFKDCIVFNNQHQLAANKINNYKSMSLAYESMGQTPLALDYFTKYHEIKDSLVGVSTQRKIADWEVKYEAQKQELKLQASKLKLASSRRKLERGMMLLGLLLAVIGIGVWRWRSQTQRAKRIQQENEANLKRLTKILIEKNYLLTTYETEIAEQSKQLEVVNQTTAEADNLYNKRILTDEDWEAFKLYFEKTYPRYINRLRTSLPNLSEAEERLFILLKLHLTRKEIAAILGISTDSVKKTRHRLRKRLGLKQEESLADYIQQF